MLAVACLAKRTRAPFHHAALATGVPPCLAPLEPAQPRLAAVLPALVMRHTLHMHAPTPEPLWHARAHEPWPDLDTLPPHHRRRPASRPLGVHATASPYPASPRCRPSRLTQPSPSAAGHVAVSRTRAHRCRAAVLPQPALPWPPSPSPSPLGGRATAGPSRQREEPPTRGPELSAGEG